MVVNRNEVLQWAFLSIFSLSLLLNLFQAHKQSMNGQTAATFPMTASHSLKNLSVCPHQNVSMLSPVVVLPKILPSPCGRFGYLDSGTNKCICRTGFAGEHCTMCSGLEGHGVFWPNCFRCHNRSLCSYHGCYDHDRCWCDEGYSNKDGKCEQCAPLYQKLVSAEQSGAAGDICVRSPSIASSPPSKPVQSMYSCYSDTDFRSSKSNNDPTAFNLKRCIFQNVCLNVDGDRRFLDLYSTVDATMWNVRPRTEVRPFLSLDTLVSNADAEPNPDAANVLNLRVSNNMPLDSMNSDIEWILEPTILAYFRHYSHPGHQFYDFDLGNFLLIREHGDLLNMTHRVFHIDDRNADHQQFRTFQDRLSNRWDSWLTYKPADPSKKRVCFSNLIAGSGARATFQFRLVQSEHLMAWRDFYMHSFNVSQAPVPGLRFLVLDREPRQNRRMLVRDDLIAAIQSSYPNATVTVSTFEGMDEDARIKQVAQHNIWISIYGWSHAYISFLPRNAAVIEIHNYKCASEVAYHCTRAMTLAYNLHDQVYALPGRDNYQPPFNDDSCHVFDAFNTWFNVTEAMEYVHRAVAFVQSYPLQGDNFPIVEPLPTLDARILP